jgi:hypothetical protein
MPQGARANLAGRHTTKMLASASHCAKPRLRENQWWFLGSNPFSFAGAYPVVLPPQSIAGPSGPRHASLAAGAR